MKTSDAENAMSYLLEGVQEKLDESGGNLNIYTAPSKMPIVNQFALLFASAFLSLIEEFKLSRNDLRVLIKIIELMQFGNVIKLSWNTVGTSLGITSNNIVRHVKTLKDAKLILEDDDGSLFLNPQIIAKGKFLSSKGEGDMERLLDIGAEALKGTSAEPSIITPKIRKEKLAEEIEKRKLAQLDKDMGLKPIRGGGKRKK